MDLNKRQVKRKKSIEVISREIGKDRSYNIEPIKKQPSKQICMRRVGSLESYLTEPHPDRKLAKKQVNSSLICLSDRANIEKNIRKLSTNLEDKSQKNTERSKASQQSKTKSASVYTWLVLIRRLFKEEYRKRKLSKIKKDTILAYIQRITEDDIRCAGKSAEYLPYEGVIGVKEIVGAVGAYKAFKKDKQHISAYEMGLILFQVGKEKSEEDNQVETARFQQNELESKKKKMRSPKEVLERISEKNRSVRDSVAQSMYSSVVGISMCSSILQGRSEGQKEMNKPLICPANQNYVSNQTNTPSTINPVNRDTAVVQSKEALNRINALNTHAVNTHANTSHTSNTHTSNTSNAQPNTVNTSHLHLVKSVSNVHHHSIPTSVPTIRMMQSMGESEVCQSNVIHSSYQSSRSRQSLAPSLNPFSAYDGDQLRRMQLMVLQCLSGEASEQNDVSFSNLDLPFQNSIRSLERVLSNLVRSHSRREQPVELNRFIQQLIDYSLYKRKGLEEYFYTAKIENIVLHSSTEQIFTKIFKSVQLREYFLTMEGIKVEGSIKMYQYVSPLIHRRMRIINISNNQLSNLTLQCPVAEFINVSDNSLKSISALLKWNNLREIHAKNNSIERVGGDNRPNQLGLIDLGNNLVEKEEHLSALRDLQSLRIINLLGNPIMKDKMEWKGFINRNYIYEYADLYVMSEYAQYKDLAFSGGVSGSGSTSGGTSGSTSGFNGVASGSASGFSAFNPSNQFNQFNASPHISHFR